MPPPLKKTLERVGEMVMGDSDGGGGDGTRGEVIWRDERWWWRGR